MRDPIKLLHKEAETKPKIQALIDLGVEGKLCKTMIDGLEEKPWVKKALKTMLETKRFLTLEQVTKIMQDGIKMIDTRDKTEYQVFSYQGGPVFVGERYQIQINQGDLILMKPGLIMIEHSEVPVTRIDVDLIKTQSQQVKNMMIEDFKDESANLRREKFGDPETELNSGGELFKFRSF